MGIVGVKGFMHICIHRLLGLRNIAPIMESQMEHELEIGILEGFIIRRVVDYNGDPINMILTIYHMEVSIDSGPQY